MKCELSVCPLNSNIILKPLARESSTEGGGEEQNDFQYQLSAINDEYCGKSLQTGKELKQTRPEEEHDNGQRQRSVGYGSSVEFFGQIRILTVDIVHYIIDSGSERWCVVVLVQRIVWVLSGFVVAKSLKQIKSRSS